MPHSQPKYYFAPLPHCFIS